MEITITCANCLKSCNKSAKEIKRQRKKGRVDFYCSLSCSITYAHKFGVYDQCKANFSELAKQNLFDKRRVDELSPFRWFILRAKGRVKRCSLKKRNTDFNINVSAEYLKSIWDEQQGICPITDWKLILPYNTSLGWINGSNLQNASLDRIDNSKGYIEGNVRFVAFIANIARGQFSDEQLKEFCQAVVNKSNRYETPPLNHFG